jgi:tryptophan-rich sensory protein
MTRGRQSIEALAISIGAVAAAAVIGASFGPQQPRAGLWYASLRKPRFTPPGPAIGATWGVLETLLCVTGYRLLSARASPPRSVALSGWAITLAGLAGFPAMFFGRRRLGPSTGVAAGMFAAASATAIAAARVDTVAAAAMLPLTAWTGFAVLLSEELWRRN